MARRSKYQTHRDFSQEDFIVRVYARLSNLTLSDNHRTRETRDVHLHMPLFFHKDEHIITIDSLMHSCIIREQQYANYARCNVPIYRGSE